MPLTRSKKNEKLSPYKLKWEDALFKYLRASGTKELLKRTLSYLDDSMDDFIIESRTSITCMIHGSYDNVYYPEIRITSKSLSTRCDCPVGSGCKHGLALALAFAWNVRKVGHPMPQGIEEYYGAAFLRLDNSQPYIDDIDEFAGLVAIETPVPIGDWWLTIAANAEWPVQNQSFAAALSRIYPGLSNWYYDQVLNELKVLANPIQRLRLLYSLCEKKLGHRIRNRPMTDPELDRFLSTQEAADLEKRYSEEIARTIFWQWLENEGQAKNQQASVDRLEVTWIAVPFAEGFSSLYFQLAAHGGQRGMVTRKRAGITKLGTDVRFGDRNYGSAANKLLTWIAETQCGYSHRTNDDNLLEDGTLIPVTAIMDWLARSTRIVKWRDGGFICSSALAAQLTISPDADGNFRWVVRFPAPPGETPHEQPLADTDIIIENPDPYAQAEDTGFTFYIRDQDCLKMLDAHGMSLVVLSSIKKLGPIPMDSLAGTRAGSALFHVLSRGSDLTGINRWVREIPCKCEVQLALSENSDLTVSARARAKDDGGPVFRWTRHGGWSLIVESEKSSPELDSAALSLTDENPLPDEMDEGSQNGPPGLVAEAENILPVVAKAEASSLPLHCLPLRADVAALENWLESLESCLGVSTFAGSGQAFTGRLTAGALNAFFPLWFRRPSAAVYFGNPEYSKMITVKRVPRISVKAEASEMDWLQVSVSVENEIRQISLTEMSRLLSANNDKFVRLSSGDIYRRDELEEYRSQVENLNLLGLTLDGGDQKLHALHLAGAPAGTLVRLEADGGALAALAEKSRKVLREFSGVPETKVPSPTGDFLRPYQQAGVNFLIWATSNFGGALLADDMGLGKTLQMLAAITSLRESALVGAKDKPPGPSLVVCPASVAHNWQREAHKFAPGLKVLVLESGAGRSKHLEELEKYDLVVMNFALLRRDIKALKPIDWFAIVADEAQAIKNPNSESSRALKQLDSRYRFALTGTPIENRISDLYSIVAFALPGYLGELDKSTASTDPESAARACQLLRSRLRPVLIRRLKVEVAPELPERVETRIDCEMGSPQKKLYAAEVKRVRLMFEGIEDSGVKGKHRIEMLAALMRLRQICCDPLLLGHPEISSGKTDELLELVPPLLEAGHKVLIFSQFVKMLNHLEEQLTGKQIRTYKLTGATTNRQALVDRFENDPEPSAFLISLKAGGTGLNLVSASHVILFDPWWNPSVEAQAIDRTHRIGQDKTVIAYRLVTTGTIEEKILELQERKRALVRNILEEDSFNRTLTSDDFRFLLDG